MLDQEAYEFGRQLMKKQMSNGFGPNELLREVASANKGRYKGKASEIWNGYYEQSAQHESHVRNNGDTGQ